MLHIVRRERTGMAAEPLLQGRTQPRRDALGAHVVQVAGALAPKAEHDFAHDAGLFPRDGIIHAVRPLTHGRDLARVGARVVRLAGHERDLDEVELAGALGEDCGDFGGRLGAPRRRCRAYAT